MEKMKFSDDMSNLSEYINQVGTAEIIRALAGSAPSIQYFAQQLGVNEKTDIHLMSTEVNFVDGKNCVFNDNDSFSFFDRQLDPAFIKTETAICANEMIGKWMGYNQRITAGVNELPFEQVFVEEFVKAAGEKLENIIWRGITIGTKTYKGFADWVVAEGTHVVAEAGSDAYAQARALIMALPEKSASKTEIFVSPSMMLRLKDALLKRDFRLIDLQFTNGTEVDEHTIKIPVFGTLVHEVSGLAGNDTKDVMFALVPEHSIYGTSVEGAHTDVKFVYDEINDRYIMRIKLTEATQVAYPAETLWCDVAAAEVVE